MRCPILFLVLVITSPLDAQSIAVQRLNALNANAAAANAEAKRKAMDDFVAMTNKWGVYGPWYGDYKWQSATNMIGKLQVGISRNSAELKILKDGQMVDTPRAIQLSGYLTNQFAGLTNYSRLKASVEATYRLRDLKAQGVPSK